MSNVNHPSHYQGKYEVIDIIEAQGWGAGFNKGNALKYILRAGRKDASKEIEDLEKARWYLDKEIMRLRVEKEKTYLKSLTLTKNMPDGEEWSIKYNSSPEAEFTFLNQEVAERIWENGKEIK